MNKANVAALHAFVEGHVQGVGFRYFALTQAQNMGISGWVRNTYRDEVEVMAEGNRDALETLLQVLWRGPASAYITGVRSEWLEATGQFSGFRIVPTD